MVLRKIFGYLLLFAVVVVSIGLLSQLPYLLHAFKRLLQVISGHGNSYDLGYSIGWIVAYAGMIVIVRLLWKLGRRMIRRS